MSALWLLLSEREWRGTVSAGCSLVAFPFVCSLPFTLCAGSGPPTLARATGRAVGSAVAGSLDPAAGGGGSLLGLHSFFSRLLAMVVENGGQNCIHLGELLLEPFALCV